jgi:hypothetical protein
MENLGRASTTHATAPKITLGPVPRGMPKWAGRTLSEQEHLDRVEKRLGRVVRRAKRGSKPEHQGNQVCFPRELMFDGNQ